MPVDIVITNIGQWRQLSQAMKKASPELRKAMFKGLRDEVTKPVLKQIRIEATYANGHLGAAAGKATRSVVKDSGSHAGVRIAMEPRKDDTPGALPVKKLGWYLDKGFWRHPVWGHGPRETWHWAGQASTNPGWFSATAESMKPQAAEAFQRVIAEFVRRLALMT